MPLPNRKKGESKKDFINRCMGNPTMKKEYPKKDQRYAVCESQASKQTDKAPTSALTLNDNSAFAAVGGEGDQFEMTVYSGKPIQNHWWWGNLAIDLEGVQFSQKTYPVLSEHDINRKIGFSKRPKVENGQLRITSDIFTYVDTAESQEFRQTAKEGFPYQASVSGRPLQVEYLDEGQEETVNGHKLKGPGSIWRKWMYREGSVAVFGADSNTVSSAFSEGEDVSFETLSAKGEQEVQQMDNERTVTLEAFKESNPEEYEKFREQIRKEAQEQAAQEFKDKLAAKEQEVSSLSDNLTKLSDQIRKLEKKDAIRLEQELQMKADRVWDRKLADADLPERLHDKVRSQVSYSQFVKDEELDIEAFTKAVEDEIQDWNGRLSVPTVKGSGASFRAPDADNTSDKEQKENEQALEELRKLSGRPLKKDAAE